MNKFEDVIGQLASAGIASPRLEARLLLAHILGCDSSSTQILNPDLSAQQEKELDILLEKRLKEHFPLDKILGSKDFYKYTFIVNEDVLSPRPDTEILVEEAIRLMAGRNLNVLDLGTGSGCILLSLLKENLQASGIGVDVSEKALDVAKQNAVALGVEKQVKWLNASWFEQDFGEHFPGTFEMIVSNPPYIPDQEISGLDAEVKNHDPMSALSGGQSGMDAYQRLSKVIPDLLSVNGYTLLECGQGQAHAVAELFVEQGLKLENILKDLQGIERCVILKK